MIPLLTLVFLFLLASIWLQVTSCGLEFSTGDANSTKAATRLIEGRPQNLRAAQGARNFSAAAYAACCGVSIENAMADPGSFSNHLILEAVSLLAAVMILLAGVGYSRKWASNDPGRALRMTAPISVLLLAAPRLLQGALSKIFRGAPTQLSRQQNLQALISQSSAELGSEASVMMHGILDLPSRQARHAMTPIPAVATVSHKASINQAAQQCADSGHTRLLVTKERPQGPITGLVHAASLMAEIMAGNGSKPIAPIVSEALLVPADSPLDKLLLYLQHQRQYLAVVVDEYAAVLGVISVEDIIEEVVGEIEDESDLQNNDMRQLPNGDLLASGYISISDLSRLSVNLPPRSESINSLGGYVFDALGRLPRDGDIITVGAYTLQVQGMEASRVAWVVISEIVD